MDTQSEKSETRRASRRFRTKEFFKEEEKIASARRQKITQRQEIQTSLTRKHLVIPKQEDPVRLIWLASIFVFIDYLAFQKALPSFLSWLLTVTPLLIAARAFFLWARLKQFPWLGPFDSVTMKTIATEESNVFHSTIFYLGLLFLAAAITFSFITDKK